MQNSCILPQINHALLHITALLAACLLTQGGHGAAAGAVDGDRPPQLQHGAHTVGHRPRHHGHADGKKLGYGPANNGRDNDNTACL